MVAPTLVAIPTKHRLDLLAPLVRELLAQGEATWIVVYANDDLVPVRECLAHPLVRVVDAVGDTVYQMWNHAWRSALRWSQCTNLLLLNDDIVIPPHFVSTLAAELRSGGWWCVYPDYECRVGTSSYSGATKETHGTYRAGGMCGWAFMLAAEKHHEGLPFVDERFEWWCGDDDLAYQIEAHGGRQARLLGLPIDHIGEATARAHPELAHAKLRDIQRLQAKYGTEVWK